MNSKNIAPVFGLNKVLWATVVQSGIITGTDHYNGLIPIIPIQEAPQFIAAMDSVDGIASYPYIVYNWYTNTISPDGWFKQTDTIIYHIYAVDQKALRQLVLLTVDLFKRWDESAGVMNSYLARAYPAIGQPDNFVDGPNFAGYEYRCYNYNYTYVTATDTNAESGENDPNKATVTIRVNYTDCRNDQSLIVPPVV